jgi:hypothetical protein
LDALYADDEDGTLVAEGLSDAEGLASLKVREYGQISTITHADGHVVPEIPASW